MVLAAVFPTGRMSMAILAVLAGIIIILRPRLIAYVIGVYLILGGVLAIIELLR